MTAQVTINPLLTSTAAGSFAAQSTGFIQGSMLDDPVARYALAGGILATTETIPMWGGVGISEFVAGNSSPGYVGSPGGPSGTLGGLIKRATAITGSTALTGFSVFNQNTSMIQSPQSPVQLAPSGGQVNFFRLGSGARIAVKADPVLASLQGADIVTTAVAWDFVNQQLIPFTGSIAVTTGNTYNSGTGVVTLNLASNPSISVGDSVIVASLTGTGSSAAIGTFTAATGTTGTVLKYVIATGLSVTINDSAGTVTTGATALPCKVLDLNVGNSMTVDYNAGTGFATWDRSGTCAIILI